MRGEGRQNGGEEGQKDRRRRRTRGRACVAVPFLVRLFELSPFTDLFDVYFAFPPDLAAISEKEAE